MKDLMLDQEFLLYLANLKMQPITFVHITGEIRMPNPADKIPGTRDEIIKHVYSKSTVHPRYYETGKYRKARPQEPWKGAEHKTQTQEAWKERLAHPLKIRNLIDSFTASTYEGFLISSSSRRNGSEIIKYPLDCKTGDVVYLFPYNYTNSKTKQEGSRLLLCRSAYHLSKLRDSNE